MGNVWCVSSHEGGTQGKAQPACSSSSFEYFLKKDTGWIL